VDSQGAQGAERSGCRGGGPSPPEKESGEELHPPHNFLII